MLRISMLPLFLALLGLSGGCQHPCQANPGQCPQLTLDVKVAPLVAEYPALIQRLAPNLAFELTLSTSDQSKFSDVSAYFCPSGSICRDGCPDSKQPLALPAPILSANGQGQTYTIPKDTVAVLPQGPARLCVSVLSEVLSGLRVYAWKEISVVNQILSSSSPQNYSVGIMNPAVSFDIDKQQRFLIVDDKNGLRQIYQYTYPNFGTASAFTFPSTNPFVPKNGSLRLVSGIARNFLIAQNMPISMNDPVVFSCTPGSTNDCSTPDYTMGVPLPPGWKIPGSSKDGIVGLTSDFLVERLIVALPDKPDTTKILAISGNLNPAAGPDVLWTASGPAGSVALVAVPLRSLVSRKVSDVVAVGKTATTPDARSVMVFLAEEGKVDPNIQADASYSAALGTAIKLALGDRQLVAMSAGDLDFDGLAEIVLLSKSATDAKLHILFNVGNGSFRLAGYLSNPETKVELEPTLKALSTLSDAIDVKVRNLDGADMNKLRPEIVVLGTKSIRVHRLD